MNNLKTFALLLTSVITLSSFAVDPKESIPEGKEIQKEIARLLDYPSIVLENAQTAQVDFMLNQKGEIVVIHVDTSSEVVETYIKNQLNYQKLSVSEAWFNKRFSVLVQIQIR